MNRHGASALGVVAIVGVVGFLVVAVLLPDLCRSPETANRVKCAYNLKQIARAIEMYRAEFSARPDSLASLLRWKELDVVLEVFVCPSSNAERADSIEALIANLDDANACSYLYTPTEQTSDETILMIERIENHDDEGMNALFADGHVEWVVHREKQVRRVNPLVVEAQNRVKQR